MDNIEYIEGLQKNLLYWFENLHNIGDEYKLGYEVANYLIDNSLDNGVDVILFLDKYGNNMDDINYNYMLIQLIKRCLNQPDYQLIENFKDERMIKCYQYTAKLLNYKYCIVPKKLN